MNIYSIGDFHLSLKMNKPMDIFGENWINHHHKIKNDWINKVKGDDLVLLAGDISWALKLNDAVIDLEFIDDLPGKKIIVSGNHDYWFTSVNKLQNMFKTISFLKNNYFVYNKVAVCGTRGWKIPGDDFFQTEDKKIYLRELARLKMSLDSLLNSKEEYSDVVVMLHFPPTNCYKENSEFINLFKKYNVKKVIYGHLHGESEFKKSFDGIYDGIEYNLVSSDFLNFKLKKII